MKGFYCPRIRQECPNGTELDLGLSGSLRDAYEEGVTIKELAFVIRRHTCSVRAAIISAGGSIRPGGPYRRGRS